ncbi:MAG: hypothetical protein K5663_00310 [Clostridiales bacterium]|nr:hypothetical protein [Clostridiales bacterium]
MKKLLCLLVALSLCISAVALADKAMGKLYDKAVHLAFDTSNVTLTAEAEFKYDGEWFKNMHASYKQDGYRSYLSYMLDSPKLDGSVYTGGYTVFGAGTTAYSNDTYFGNYYSESATKLSDKVLVRTPKTDMLLGLGKLLALNSEDYVTQTEADGVYTFKTGALNDVINRSAYYLVMDYIRDNYYLDTFHEWEYSSNGEKFAAVYYEDFQKLAAEKYAQVYGEEYPVNAQYDQIDENTLGRYDVVLKMLDQMEKELQKEYQGKVVFVKNDSTAQVFDSYEDYALSRGTVEIEYANYLAALKDFHLKTYGEELTDQIISVVSFTSSEELWRAYLQLGEEMDAYYTQMVKSENPKAIYAVVREDGTIKSYQSRMGQNDTVARKIMANISYAALEALDAEVTLDEQDNLSCLKGTAAFTVDYTDGSAHTLEIAFTLEAKDYGTTSVPDTFEPKDYGLVSYNEFVEHLEAEGDGADYIDIETFIANAPKTVSFMGKTFESKLEYYGGAN